MDGRAGLVPMQGRTVPEQEMFGTDMTIFQFPALFRCERENPSLSVRSSASCSPDSELKPEHVSEQVGDLTFRPVGRQVTPAAP